MGFLLHILMLVAAAVAGGVGVRMLSPKNPRWSGANAPRPAMAFYYVLSWAVLTLSLIMLGIVLLMTVLLPLFLRMTN